MNVKRLLHLACSAAAVAGVAFVVVAFRNQAEALQDVALTWPLMLVLTGAALCYGFASVLLALAWRHVLIHLGAPINSRWAVWAHGLSQLGKYVPGNVFHFAGRQALGVANGLPSWPLIKTAARELGLQASSGRLFLCLLLPIATGAEARHWLIFASVAVFCSAALLYAWVLSRSAGSHIRSALYQYQLFQVLGELSLFAIIMVLQENVGAILPLAPVICGAYVIAWLLGLITPRAPAGVGVREATLYVILIPILDASHVIVAAVLTRLVAIVGDLTYFTIAFLTGLSSRTADKQLCRNAVG